MERLCLKRQVWNSLSMPSKWRNWQITNDQTAMMFHNHFYKNHNKEINKFAKVLKLTNVDYIYTHEATVNCDIATKVISPPSLLPNTNKGTYPLSNQNIFETQV